MIRTQIYLTGRQRSELASISKILGKKQSELIRDAVDHFIEQSRHKKREMVLQKAAGLWKDRDDLPDFDSIRSEWDR